MAQENNFPKNDTVGLFLRAMVDREPGKRKVKPSKAALIDLAELDLGESSDDSDFNVDEAKLKEDDDISINSDQDDDDDDEEDDDDEDEGEEEKNVPVYKNVAPQTNDKANLSIGELIAQAEEKQALAFEQGVVRPKILVCAICLGEYSDDANEIVTCDGCHVSVHEGCYGISDTISVSSTVSSSSTEPWFCDACKAGVSNPPCELCPNQGYTIFKETEMGRWVHLVCALYVPGVAFSEVDKLSFPTMFEMPYSRYGAKTCSLCEDERFCKTGVCIGCDAGMCRSYFHVTCAQREGLLSEVNHGEADQADPYYAHCKLHTDRELMRRRKRNWLALQLHMKQGEKHKLSESQETQDRLQRKLIKYREMYMFSKSNRPTPWFPTQKMPRSLSTCASFFRSLLHKTTLMGLETESRSAEQQQTVGDVRKKWHISPAFNVEFISYYLDRTSRLQEMKSKLNFLLKENGELMKEETLLRSKYNSLNKDAHSLEAENSSLLNKALEMHDLLKGLAGRPLRLPPVVAALHNPPFVGVETTLLGGTAVGGAGKEKRLITKAAAKMMGASLPAIAGGLEGTSNLKSSSTKSSPNSLHLNAIDTAAVMSIHTCSVCALTKEQHLLIQCDTCSNYYHLYCLDPPLSRMPKKTKQMGWQCSDCCKSSDSDKAPEIDTAAPRRLRRVIKEPSKFSPSVSKDQKSAQERQPEAESKGDAAVAVPTPSKAKGPRNPAPKAGGTKRRLSADAKRGKKKMRRRSLDTPRKGNKGSKSGPSPEGAPTPAAPDTPPAPSLLKKEAPILKVEIPLLTLPKLEAPPLKAEIQPLKAEAPPTKTEVTPSKAEAPPPKAEAPPLTDKMKVESKEEKPSSPSVTALPDSSVTTPTRATRTRKGGTDSPSRPLPKTGTDSPSKPLSKTGTDGPSRPVSKAGTDGPSRPFSKTGTEITSKPLSKAVTESPPRPLPKSGTEAPSKALSIAGTGTDISSRSLPQLGMECPSKVLPKGGKESPSSARPLSKVGKESPSRPLSKSGKESPSKSLSKAGKDGPSVLSSKAPPPSDKDALPPNPLPKGEATSLFKEGPLDEKREKAPSDASPPALPPPPPTPTASAVSGK